MIVLRDNQCYRHCLKELKSLGLVPVKTVQPLNAVICRFRAGANLKPLQSHSMIRRIESDKKMRLHVLTSGQKKVRTSAECASLNSNQTIPWGIARIGAPRVWRSTQGGTVKVAVIDTGVLRNHPDLRVVRGYNTLSSRRVTDENGHGTHVAGTIAALNNRFGVVGAAPRVKLYAVKAFNKNGDAYVSDIAQALAWCIRNGMHVINMSFGMPEESPTVKALLRRAYARGIVLVASAGNAGRTSGPIDFPARLPEVIAVAASTQENTIADFSNRGTGLSVSAPGVDICSTYLNRSFMTLSGTSMAVPHVSGAAALLKARNPRRTPLQIRRLLQSTAVPLPGYTVAEQGAGEIRL